MMPLDSFSIVWDASIIPGVSLAGIPLHASAVDLEAVLSKYLTDKNSSLYRFEGAPELCLSRYGLDDRGNGGYSFSIFDDEIVSELKKGVPALSVLIRSGRVYAVKVYDFSFPGEPAHRLVYKGLLSECIGSLNEIVGQAKALSQIDKFHQDAERLGEPLQLDQTHSCERLEAGVAG